MTEPPVVSVVMPVYNSAETIEEALRSIFHQTYANLEIFVVDDGSVDRSMDIVEHIRDSRVRILRHEHLGVVAALRRGCEQAQGAYIARLDADDVADERRVAVQVEYLEAHPDVGLLGSYATFESPSGEKWFFTPPVSDAKLRRYLLWDNPFVHSSVMFRPVAYQQAGGYTEGPPTEDYRLWIQIARNWKLAVVADVLVTHRIRPTSHSRAVRRDAALRDRLLAQWEAATRVGPWFKAMPALAMTCTAYLLSVAGARVDTKVRSLFRRTSERARGFRDVGQPRR